MIDRLFKKLIGFVFSPVVFGLGFLAPLVAQTLTRLDVSMGIENLYVGLFVGLALGLMAQFRGSWIWVKP